MNHPTITVAPGVDILTEQVLLLGIPLHPSCIKLATKYTFMTMGIRVNIPPSCPSKLPAINGKFDGARLYNQRGTYSWVDAMSLSVVPLGPISSH